MIDSDAVIQIEGSLTAKGLAIHLINGRAAFECGPLREMLPAKWWEFRVQDARSVTLPRPGIRVRYPNGDPQSGLTAHVSAARQRAARQRERGKVEA